MKKILTALTLILLLAVLLTACSKEKKEENLLLYLKFDEGTIFPEILSKQPHVAYNVDNIEFYADQAQQVIFGPKYFLDDPSTKVRLAFVIWDDAIIELYEDKN